MHNIMVDYLLRSYFLSVSLGDCEYQWLILLSQLATELTLNQPLGYNDVFYHLYAGGEAQDCNEWINISTHTTELIIDTTINRTCLQCLANRTDVPDRWEIREGKLDMLIAKTVK